MRQLNALFGSVFDDPYSYTSAKPGDDYLRRVLGRDHVIAHMLEHQGAVVREVEAPFDPEGGAYHDHAAHEHGHGH